MQPGEHVTKPDIIVPDASPLIHLALSGALHLLHEIGGTVILVDVVADEVTRNPAMPGAFEVERWLAQGTRPGSNAPVHVMPTETGRAIALARVTDPSFAMRNGGETAIVEWLVETVQGTDAATIVLYENGRVPSVIAAQGIDSDIDVVTTRAFLDLAERRGLIASAAAMWGRIVAVAPTVNPKIAVFSQRRPPQS